MSKAETLNSLMESAIHVFSRDGYEGASLREIARNANVPLSTIHFYFRSKSDLFAEVGRQAWIEIDQERSAHLEQAMSANANQPTLDMLVYALAYPVVRRALSKSRRDLAQLYILRSHTSHLEPGISDHMLKVADRSMGRWIDPMQQCCPELGREDMIWAFSFVIGAIYSWQLIDHRYDSMMGADVVERSIAEVTSDIVAFCARGIEAMAMRRKAPPIARAS